MQEEVAPSKVENIIAPSPVGRLIARMTRFACSLRRHRRRAGSIVFHACTRLLSSRVKTRRERVADTATRKLKFEAAAFAHPRIASGANVNFTRRTFLVSRPLYVMFSQFAPYPSRYSLLLHFHRRYFFENRLF